jgi:hypothetical protein
VDVCKGPGAEADLTFSYAELGLAQDAQVLIVNPLGGP